MKKLLLTLFTGFFTLQSAFADTVPHILSGGSLSQTWSHAGLITTNDSWSGVPSITGYLGDLDAASVTGVNPQTVLGSNGTVDVIANQTTPNTSTAGGVAEFAITNPTVALQGSGTADSPYISIFLNTTGVAGVTVSYKLRDIDGSADNAQQQVALQYRIGSSGNFTDVPAAYVSDASTGPSLATLETNVSATLPAAVVGNALVEVRIITCNAAGSDEWVGIDDIVVAAGDSIVPTASTFAPADNATGVPITATPSIIFSEPVQKGVAGDILIKRSSDNSIIETIAITSSQITVSSATVTITPASSFANTTGYYLEIPAGAIEDIAGNDYAGLSGAAAWNFVTIAPSVLPSSTKTFATQTRVTPTGSSSTTDYYAEGSGQGSFAVYGFGTFNFSKLDFGLSGASTINSITTAEFTLRQNNRSFSTGTQFEFFLTTDSSTGKTFNAADPQWHRQFPTSACFLIFAWMLLLHANGYRSDLPYLHT